MQRRLHRYDVVVVGGGAAGLAAALGAARQGARTLLVERYGFLGGAATNALVLTYCGYFIAGERPVQAVGGVGWELLLELRQLGLDTTPVRSRSGNWIVMLDPEAVKFAFDQLASSPRLDVWLHSRVVSAGTADGLVHDVQVADHAGIHDVQARAFVDASGEASLSAFAGVPLSQPGGAQAHLQPASLPVRIGGVPDDAVIDRERLSELVKRYNATASSPLHRADGGVLARLPVSGDLWWMGIDLDTEGLGGPVLARAEITARRQAWEFLPLLRELPGFENAHIVMTGPQIGLRETRRPCSRRDVTAADGQQGRRCETGIGRGCWPMEVHEAPGRSVFTPIGGEGWFDIPHASLQAEWIDNLWLGGRVTGADPTAYGSTRVMGTAFVTGQAAGVSAALQAGASRAPGGSRPGIAQPHTPHRATPDVKDVRRRLVEQHAIV